MDAHKTGHAILDVLLLTLGTATGVVGEVITVETLEYYDTILSLVLKGVSILSFLVVLILNANKLVKMVKRWFKPEKIK